jgi:hypothetical protein
MIKGELRISALSSEWSLAEPGTAASAVLEGDVDRATWPPMASWDARGDIRGERDRAAAGECALASADMDGAAPERPVRFSPERPACAFVGDPRGERDIAKCEYNPAEDVSREPMMVVRSAAYEQATRLRRYTPNRLSGRSISRSRTILFERA